MKRLCTLVLIAFGIITNAQESPFYKFGKVTVADLQQKLYSVDSNAHAVILSDIGDCQIEGNSKSSFSLVFKHHRVAHILNKAGYSLADVEIPLYVDGSEEEKMQNIKAVTYSLENGKVIETKLEKSAIFKDKKDKNWTIVKFTMPNVKEGCIIEYEYELKSDYINHLKPWSFQGSYPRVWSEYKLSIPEFLNYVTIGQGYIPFTLKDRKERSDRFTISETRSAGATESASINANVTDYRWVIKNVPELKKESFTSTLENHIEKLEFQLSGTRNPLRYSDYMGTWQGLTKNLKESEYFGSFLSSGNGWISDYVKAATTGAGSDDEKARKLFAYVRDNITCTDHSAVYMDQSLKNVIKTRKGSVSEINLLLTAMLRYAKLDAEPVILSTRDHGFTYPMYPIITRFNYVVAQVKQGDHVYYLDASDPHMGFGKLPSECYNGHARIVNDEATAISFVPDSLLESKLTSLLIINSEKGNWQGSMNQIPGYYESSALRDKIKNKDVTEVTNLIKKNYDGEVKISNVKIDSIDTYDMPVGIHYDLDFQKSKEDIIYLNPMFGEGYKKNPFQSAERFYPVEMPYASNETYILTLDVPEGYVVDEIPKQMLLKLDDRNSGSFEYRISQSGNTISMRTQLKINRASFEPEEYDMLREFFNIVVKKQNEQIVFKKKK